MSKRVTVFRFDDWEALYVDGKYVADYHEVVDGWMEDELRSLGYVFESYEPDPEAYNGGDFPQDATDVLLDDGFYYGEKEQAGF